MGVSRHLRIYEEIRKESFSPTVPGVRHNQVQSYSVVHAKCEALIKSVRWGICNDKQNWPESNSERRVILKVISLGYFDLLITFTEICGDSSQARVQWKQMKVRFGSWELEITWINKNLSESKADHVRI